MCESPGGCIVVCGASCSANTAELLLQDCQAWTWEGAYNVGGLDTKTVKQGIMRYIVAVCCVEVKITSEVQMLVIDELFHFKEEVL